MQHAPCDTLKSLQNTYISKILSGTQANSLNAKAEIWRQNAWTEEDTEKYLDNCAEYLAEYPGLRVDRTNTLFTAQKQGLDLKIRKQKTLIVSPVIAFLFFFSFVILSLYSTYTWISIPLKTYDMLVYMIIGYLIDQGVIGQESFQILYWLCFLMVVCIWPHLFEHLIINTLRKLDWFTTDTEVIYGRTEKASNADKIIRISPLQLNSETKSLKFLHGSKITQGVVDQACQNELLTLAELPTSAVMDAAKHSDKKRKPNKIRQSGVKKPGESVDGYYHAKPIDWTVLDEPNPDVILDIPEYEGQIGALRTWAYHHPNPVVKTKGELKNWDQFEAGKTVSKSGFVSLSQGQEVQEYEWSSKVVQNKVSALSRQLSGKTRVDQALLPHFAMMVTRFYDMCFWSQPVVDFRPSSFFDYIGKDTWTLGKQLKYFNNIRKALTNNRFTNYLGSFDLMVKSGEVYSSTILVKNDDGYTVDRPDRPRAIMNPCENGCGILAAVQSQLWSVIKERVPGFIQGLSKPEMESLFKEKVKADWKSISIDGSAFDSTQFSVLQQIVENEFWDWARPLIKSMVEVQYGRTLDSDIIVDRILLAAKDTKNVVFVNIPEVNSPEWPDDVKRIWRRDYPAGGSSPWQDNIFIRLDGTTFSGHSVKTTLGNTFRSLCYMYYYIEQAGFDSPWARDDMFVVAAGDDVVVWCRPEYSQEITHQIMTLSSRTKQAPPRGLG